MARVCPTCGTSYDATHVFCPSDGTSLRALDDGGELIGSVIADRYLITERIGEGGMGRVYLAQHVRLPQRAAIKVLHPALVHDADALARFIREASNACQISHQNVARVYDFGEGGSGVVYLAMEYVPGITLGALLDKAGALAPQRAMTIVRQIAAGLDAAHKLGIVHRDLKPDNILVVREEDGTELVKVVDFGIAKAVDSGTQGVTRAGLVIGTALYMSPEQVSGHVIDRRSDVYALGLVAFVSLTGKLPFPGETAEEAMIRRLTERPLTLAEALPEVAWPDAVQRVFDRALAREIAERHPSAVAFANELSAAIEAWQRPPRVAEPSPAAVGGAAGRDAPGDHLSGTTGADHRPAPTSRPGRRRVVAVGGTASVLAAAVLVALLIGPGGDPPGETDSGVLAGDSARTPASPSPTTSVPPRSGQGTTTGPEARPDVRGTPSIDNGPAAADAAAPATERRVSAPPPTRPSAEPPSDADRAAAAELLALARLDSVIPTLDPDVITEERARRAAITLRDLLPSLRSAHDSLRAELNRANAYFYLQRIPEACATLRSARALATFQSRAEIDAQLEALGCGP